MFRIAKSPGDVEKQKGTWEVLYITFQFNAHYKINTINYSVENIQCLSREYSMSIVHCSRLERAYLDKFPMLFTF